MADPKLPARPAVHHCPVCSFPQTKITRKLSDERYGATIYVCSRAGQCAVGLNLTKVDTWVVV